jgi:hypothetical protein
MISMKQKRTIISNIIGSELRMVDTKLDMPGIELMVRSGLSNLITLIAEMFCFASCILTQPRITTKKSSYSNRID